MIISETISYTFPQDENGRWFAKVYREKLEKAGYGVKTIKSNVAITLRATRGVKVDIGGDDA